MQNIQRKACLAGRQVQSKETGQAVIASVIFLVLLSVVIIAGFATPLTRQLKSVRAAFDSRQAYFAAESGVEDAAYRLKNKLAYAASYNLTVGGATAAVSIIESGNTRTINVTGDTRDHIRKLSTQLDLSEVGADLFYGVQVSDGGLFMRAGSRVNGSVYSNGDIICESGECAVTGDAIVAGGIANNPSDSLTDDDADEFFATNVDNKDIAQSFGAASGGPLNKVSVYLAKVGNPSSNITLRITADDNGHPDDSDLAAAVITVSQVGASPSWIDVAFVSPPTLSANTTYWLVLDYNSYSSVNYWNWRKNSAGVAWFIPRAHASVNHAGKTAKDWSQASAVWTTIGFADLLFKVWIGGTTTKIEDMTIGDATTGTGRANLFVDTEIHGADCPNVYCVVSNPARAELPISDGVIQDWRDDAVLGGVINGNYLINDTGIFGPKEVAGNLTIDLGNDETLTITGTIWVTGNLIFSCASDSHIALASGYGASSGVIVADGEVTVGNNCAFAGSGQAGSYLMVLSAKTETDKNNPVMTINNNSEGVIYYAGKGWITFSQNAGAKEVTGYGIKMENNSTVTYEFGLANINFTSGPGGAFQITKWQEVE